MRINIVKTQWHGGAAWARPLRLLRVATPVLLLTSAAAFAGGADVTIISASQAPQYGWDDSLFMIDTKPVQVVMSGTVPSLSPPSLLRSITTGMSSAAPMTCCAAADDNFRIKAPLVFAPAKSQAGNAIETYQVVWRFQEDGQGTAGPPATGAPQTVVASAELWHGGDRLTQAQGQVTLTPNQSAAESEQTMAALVRTVEKRLTPFPDNWIAGAGGGG